MKQALFIIIVLFSIKTYGQEDTVYITYNKGWIDDTLNYVTDTVLFPTGMQRHILTGTSILPGTYSQQVAKGYGLYLDKVTKSECQYSEPDVYWSSDKINTISLTDSTLSIDINIYENCCYDFLCDISVDSVGTLNLNYTGYGTYCTCSCCFGLTYHMKKKAVKDFDKIKSVMINQDERTLKQLK